MVIKVSMPNGADSGVSEKAVFVIRSATPSEKRENPQVLSTIWTGSAKIYPAETLDELAAKFSAAIKLARLTAPNGTTLFVSMANVVDADPPSDQDAQSTRTVLYADSKPKAPRQGVREDVGQLRALWAAQGLPLDVFS
jgi:hypothetical protein